MADEPKTPPAPAEPETVSVTFTAQHGSYNAGETASFPPDQAKALIDQKVAEPAGGGEHKPRAGRASAHE